MCFNAKFDSSMTKDVGISKGNHENWGAMGPAFWDESVADLIKRRLSPDHTVLGRFKSKSVGGHN